LIIELKFKNDAFL